MTESRKRDVVLVAIGAVVIVLDQLVKRWIVDYFHCVGCTAPVPLVGQLLELNYVQNTGVAFSLFQGQSVQFLLIALAVGAIGYLYWRTRETATLLLKISFGLVLGGAVGNLIDRFARGFVVDFIHFHIPGVFEFAVFNVADAAISCGVALLAFLLWRGATTDPATPRDDALEAATPLANGENRPLPRVRRKVTSVR